MKTAEKIRQLRIEKGLSQEALGELVGVKKAAINKYETGRVVNIKKSMLVKLADALGVLPAALLDDVDGQAVYSSDEQCLIELYRKLNETGRQKIVSYTEDLVALGKYTDD
jgi:transcriptional regulator with XRE-family HTH domain